MESIKPGVPQGPEEIFTWSQESSQWQRETSLKTLLLQTLREVPEASPHCAPSVGSGKQLPTLQTPR